MNDSRFTVIGAGHGGRAMAAHLALMGFKVTLYNRTPERVAAIHARRGLDVDSFEDGPHGFARLDKVTCDMAEAVHGADLIMVVVPSSAHSEVARESAPHLRDGQIVVLHPGRTLGAVEFREVLCAHGCTADVMIAEAETFLYACRSDGPAQVRIQRIKEAVPVAALPATRTTQVIEALAPAYPQFIDGVSVLHTGLNNMGAIFDPALTILNAGRIESTFGDFEFYMEGVTTSTARVLEALDRERVTVAAALGIRARPAMEWLQMAYAATGEDLNEAIHNQTGYAGIKAPSTLNHRFIFEDIPMCLVPIAALGQHYGVSVRGMDAMIRLACIIHRTDYWRRGRTLEKLGIDRLSVGELTQYVMEGERCWEA